MKQRRECRSKRTLLCAKNRASTGGLDHEWSEGHQRRAHHTPLVLILAVTGISARLTGVDVDSVMVEGKSTRLLRQTSQVARIVFPSFPLRERFLWGAD